MAPLGKKRLLEALAAGKVPVAFGSPHPTMAVVAQDGCFRLRHLAIDAAEAAAESARALAEGRNWMPEHHYALGRPTGKVVLEAATLAELQKKIAAHAPWPADW